MFPCEAGSLHLAGPSEYLADLFAGSLGPGPVDPQDIWRKDVPDASVVEIKEYGGSIAMHCSVNTELSGTRGQLPVLYVEAPASGLWEARVAVSVEAEVSAGFTVLDADGMMPDILFGFDKFTSRGFGTSGGVAALSYSNAGLSGIVASQDFGSQQLDWIVLKLVRTGSGRYDLYYSYGLGDAWLAPDDARNSDASARQRVFVKTAGSSTGRLFSESEWRPLAQQIPTIAQRRIGLYIMTGSNGGSAKFKDFLVRDLFPQSVVSWSLDDGQLRESLDSSGISVTGVSSVSGRDGYAQGALLFTDGTALELPTDPLQLDTYTNDSLGEFTISLWIKPYSTSAGGILGRRLAQHLPGIQLSPHISMNNQHGLEWSILDEAGQNYSATYETPTQQPYATTLPTSSSTSLAKVLEVNEWLHIAFVKEADTLLFYRNGKRWGFASLAPDSQLSDASGVFLLNYINGVPYHGAVDDLRFYDVGLADFAIEHLYSNSDTDTWRGKTQRCMAGTICNLTLTGEGLSDKNKYAVLGHCGRSPAIPGVPDSGISEAGPVIYWGSSTGLPLTAPGGKYEICWCGEGGTACLAPGDFRVFVGTLVVVGPYFNQRTCTMGQVASFELQGMELSLGDQVRILDTCGVESPLLSDLPFNGTSDLEPSGCYGHVGLGVVVGTAAEAHGSGLKGKTQTECCNLCRRSLYNDCVAWLHRPSDQTCFLYRSITTVERQEDRVLGFSELNPLSLFLATTLTGNRPGADSSGPFRLYVCRSALDCHYATAVTLLSLSNIEAYQTFQATATWPAAWEWNAVKIFSDTTDRWYLESLVVTANGFSWNFTYSGWLESGAEVFLTRDPPSQYFFGNSWNAATPSSASGGNYRLCWCSSTSGCATESDFSADGGELTLRGPIVGQHLTCLTGQPCSWLGLLGMDLSDGDKVMVLDTCGNGEDLAMIWDGVSISHPSLVPRFTPSCQSHLNCQRDIPCDDDAHSQYARPALACGISDPASSGDYTWGAGTPVGSPGGIYKICWCAAGQSCSMFEHFRMELGELSLIGPSSMEQHRTCVAGQPCVVSNILGYLQQTGDKIMILDECGKAEKASCTQMAQMAQMMTQTNLSLPCESVTDRWPGSTVGSGARGISEPAVSSVHPCGSSMTWIPFHGSSSCYSVFGTQKTWANAEAECDAIYGGHLVSITSQEDLDFLLQWILVQGEAYWIGLNDQATEGLWVNSDGASTFFNWGVLQPQAASGSNTEDCVYISDGLFYDDVCTTSRKYICERPGAFVVGASSGDEFRFGGYQTPQESLIPPSSAGGQYRMCWCSGAQCSQAEDFRMDFGALTLIGPSLHQHKTCVAGQPCTFDLLGTDLQNNDLVHVLETCGSYVNVSQFSHYNPGVDSAFHLPRFPTNNGVQSQSAGATASGSAISWGSSSVTAMGGLYRLCWCASGYSCSAAPEFRVDFGRTSAKKSVEI